GQLRAQVGAMWERDILPGLQSRRGPANGWLQDRAAMADGSWSGIKGIMNEDIACQESMGPIYDRSREHLGTADRAILHMRRLMLEAARALEQGGHPLGQAEPVDYPALRASDGLVGRSDEVPAQ
ncbi:MAG: MarR family transcriptional regulator, partial [Actinomycetota bacterium]|nr:MarR family transcriptional regulator [Actinomycetota bacterium]